MKKYLIIGASSGIGKNIAEDLSKAGNKVFGTFCKTASELSENIHYEKLDVVSDDINFDFIEDHLDGFVYCPGAITLKPFHRIKTEQFSEDYNLQVMGAVKTLQVVLPKLKVAENPSVVLFSSVAVQTGFNYHSLVASSKGAIEGLTKALAAEWAPKIRINCIAPSLTNTPLAKNLLNTPEKIEANSQKHPLKKVGESKDISDAALFLLSEKSKWITGQIIHVDGGMSTIKM